MKRINKNLFGTLLAQSLSPWANFPLASLLGRALIPNEIRKIFIELRQKRDLQWITVLNVWKHYAVSDFVVLVDERSVLGKMCNFCGGSYDFLEYRKGQNEESGIWEVTDSRKVFNLFLFDLRTFLKLWEKMTWIIFSEKFKGSHSLRSWKMVSISLIGKDNRLLAYDFSQKTFKNDFWKYLQEIRHNIKLQNIHKSITWMPKLWLIFEKKKEGPFYTKKRCWELISK